MESVISGVIAIVAAIAGSVITLVGQFASNKVNRRIQISNYQTEEYLKTLDAALDAMAALRSMGSALSGRTEPGPKSPQEELDENRERDKRAAEAISRLSDALRLLSRQAYRVEAIGSIELAAVGREVNQSIDDYMRRALDRALEDQMFIASDFNCAIDKLQVSITHLSEVIRKDLEIDKLNK